jgi:hypothetical protein
MRRSVLPRLGPAAMAVCVLLGQAATARAQAGYTGSVNLVRDRSDSSGSTDAVYVFNSVDVTRGRFRATATVPLVSQRIESTVVPADDTAEPAWSGGLGDPMLRADVTLLRRRTGGLAVSVSGAVKIPVADAEGGTGSGEYDGSVGVTLMGARGRSSFLADVTYWVLGDPPDTIVRNVPAVYLGYATVLDRGYRWSAMFGVSSAASVVPGLAPPTQGHAGVLRMLRSGTAVGATVSVGLNDAAADLAVGAIWRVAF